MQSEHEHVTMKHEYVTIQPEHEHVIMKHEYVTIQSEHVTMKQT